MDPQGTPLVSGLHLDNELLTITLCTWPSSHFFTYQTVKPLNIYLFTLVARMSWGTISKGLTAVQVDSYWLMSFIFIRLQNYILGVHAIFMQRKTHLTFHSRT